MDPTIHSAFSELFVPARTLPYGIYEMRLTVSMPTLGQLASSASAYVRITPSKIIANLLELGTSFVNCGREQDLILNPGRYSVNPDGYPFNASVSLV